VDDDYDLNYEHGGDTPGSDLFAGHDAAVPDDYRYAIPELAGAQALASASATGSNKARRQARIMVALAFGLPLALGMLIWAVSAIAG
jgi:3',5'-cyclic AMP phosphodiesterase CpdA